MSKTQVVHRAKLAFGVAPLVLVGPGLASAREHAGNAARARNQNPSPEQVCGGIQCYGGNRACAIVTFPDGTYIYCYQN